MAKLQAVKRSDAELDIVPSLEWARLAMAIDTEGAICILRQGMNRKEKRRSIRHFLHVSVANTDLRLLVWLRNTFGGGVYDMPDPRGQFKQRRACFSWVVSSGYAEKLLRRSESYFLIKRDQVDVALAFQKTFGGNKGASANAVKGKKGWQNGISNALPPEIIAERETFKAQLSLIKRPWLVA